MKQKKFSDQQTQSIVQDIQYTHRYSTEIPVSDTKFIDAACARNPNERWTVDSNPNLPMDREITVLEAEQQSDNSEWN